MTAERDYCDFPNYMVLACHSIIPFVDGMCLDNYLADEKTRYAVMRAYEPKSGSWMIACLCRIVGTVGDGPIAASAFASPCG